MKPILFNTEMVKAILEDRKTSTRRIIKPQPRYELRQREIDKGTNRWNEYGKEKVLDKITGSTWGYGRICRYQVGDILYVRETWMIQSMSNFDKRIKFMYRAQGNKDLEIRHVSDERYEKLLKYGCKNGWQPSLFMPREAARIFLKVTDIKAQRLQDITEREVLKEGIRRYHFNMNMPDAYGDKLYTDPKVAFQTLWNSTVNKKDIDVYGWDADPYVWVIEFQRVDKEG
ncbi:hypothetical protein AB8U03_15470 [Clostridium sp. Mt-5]|uniref:Uncharacterized protein n=1 Tax=Clostridium moutaii TaxID=3240932 RepID=A0ABV4BS15_9CLOT